MRLYASIAPFSQFATCLGRIIQHSPSDLIQKFAAELSASFACRCVLVVLVGQGRQCLLHSCDKRTVARQFYYRLLIRSLAHREMSSGRAM